MAQAQQAQQKKQLSPQEAAAAKAKRQQEKAENFIKLANLRVPKAIDAIKRIANLSSSNYVSTPDQVSKIEQLLRETVDNVVREFRVTKTASAAPVRNIF